MEFDNPFIGSWSYRSFRNDPDLSQEFGAFRFGAGTLDLTAPEFGRLSGTLGGEGWRLDLTRGYSYGNPFAVRFQGLAHSPAKAISNGPASWPHAYPRRIEEGGGDEHGGFSGFDVQLGEF